MPRLHAPVAPAASRIKPSGRARQPNREPAPRPLHEELARKLSELPKDPGIILIGLGAVGIAIPGPIPPGVSFVLLGLVFLRPGLLARFGGWLAKRFPSLFRAIIGFVDHLRTDLERRYPGSVRA